MQIEFQYSVDAAAGLGEPLLVTAQGGYRYGADALDNPAEDSMIQGESAAIEVTPDFLKTQIEYLGPENETATGENFIQSYRVSFDVVQGFSVDDLRLVTELDDKEVFMGVREMTWADNALSLVSQPQTGVVSADQNLTFSTQQWVGTDGIDGSFIVDLYVPQSDANDLPVIDLVGAGDSKSIISTYVSGSRLQNSTAASDTVDRIEFTSVPVVHELQGELLAVQQSVQLLNNRNANSLGPGDTVEYTIDFQISDYAVLEDLQIAFSIPDGQLFAGSHTGLLQLSGLTSSQGFNQELMIPFGEVPSSTPGEQNYVADIALAMANAGIDARIVGGLTENGSGSAMTGSITYQATLQDQFIGEVQSGDRSVDEGDLFTSHVNASAVTIDPANGERSEFFTRDDSGTSKQLKVAEVTTSVFAVNGTQKPDSLAVTAGDLVTFRITREVTSSDIENLILSEFLPLPVFSVDQLVWSNDSSDPLGENQIQLGPDDSLHGLLEVRPAFQIDLQNNSFSLDYGDLDWSENQTSLIDLLVTLRVQDRPFADGMWLSSLANSRQSSSNNGDFVSNAIADIQYTRPSLTITKSAIDSSNANAVMVSVAGGGTDIASVDAGDIVVFETIVENTGSSQNGAYDVLIRDSLPMGFIIPETGLKLQLVDGDGNAVEYRLTETQSTSDLFNYGIELVDPIPATQVGNAAGQILIRYELEVADNVQPNFTIASNVSVLHYAAIAGGENYVVSPIEDDASITISHGEVIHSMVHSDQSHTTGRSVVIGETVTYRAVVRIPEGTTSQASLQLKAPRGMAFNELISLNLSDSLFIDGQDAASVAANTTITGRMGPDGGVPSRVTSVVASIIGDGRCINHFNGLTRVVVAVGIGEITKLQRHDPSAVAEIGPMIGDGRVGCDGCRVLAINEKGIRQIEAN